MRSADVRAQGELSLRWTGHAVAGPASPLFKARLQQGNTDQHDSRAGDDGREDLFDDGWRHEGDEDLDQGAAGRCSEEGAVRIGAGKLGAVFGCLAETVLVHLGDGFGGHRNDAEGDTDD